MKVLFVCSQGLYRSPTARDLWKKMHPKDEIDTIGVLEVSEETLKKKAEWADKIIVMENMHKKLTLKVTGDSMEVYQKIVVLDIPDIYDRDVPELIALLKKKFKMVS